eukprot:6202161-Pleurochrysis_carterae.AAC.2
MRRPRVGADERGRRLDQPLSLAHPRHEHAELALRVRHATRAFVNRSGGHPSALWLIWDVSSHVVEVFAGKKTRLCLLSETSVVLKPVMLQKAVQS